MVEPGHVTESAHFVIVEPGAEETGEAGVTVDKATLNLSGGGKGLNAADYITLTSGTFDSYGYAEGGTISGGTSATLGQSSSGGGQPGGPGGNQPGGPGGRW